MAQAGLKTVLVSADLRRPSIGEAFGLKREPGLSELITKAVGLKDVLRNVVDLMLGDMGFDDVRLSPGLENLWIIPTGRLPYNPAEILKSTEINNLIENLKSKFDIIVFDSPPVLPVTDASLLAPKMDSVVLVYEIGRTSREALIRSKAQLESVGAKINGVILNHTKPETEAISVYHSYRYQYGGPGDKKREKKEHKEEFASRET
jgi:capsular exopolysaccharide synthesis family protein